MAAPGRRVANLIGRQLVANAKKGVAGGFGDRECGTGVAPFKPGCAGLLAALACGSGSGRSVRCGSAVVKAAGSAGLVVRGPFGRAGA
jgi:hypothetical protein